MLLRGAVLEPEVPEVAGQLIGRGAVFDARRARARGPALAPERDVPVGGGVVEGRRELRPLLVADAGVDVVDAPRDGVHVEEPLVDDVPVCN